jgi:tRNA(Ile)-lysidine synthase
MYQLFRERLKHLSGDISDTGLADKKYLLAVSGGIDSMCMAHLFLKSGIMFSVAHVNFSLRDSESDGDQKLVEEWAASNKIQFYTTRFNTTDFADSNSVSIQMAARELRYKWLDELMKRHSFDFLAVAHNLNDSAETLFINLLRGTGIEGLTGIKERGGYIIRPLLGFSREEITEFVKLEQIPFRNDSSNEKSYYSRNRIRNCVFPEFSKINPSFLKTLESDIRHFSDTAEVINQMKISIIESISEHDCKNLKKIDVEKLLKLKQSSFWLFNILSDYGFNSSQCSDIFDSLRGVSGKKFESLNYILVKDREFLLLYNKSEIEAEKIENETITIDEIESGTSVFFGNMEITVRVLEVIRPFTPPANPMIQSLDFDKIIFPVVIRRWSEGDRFMPLGMDKFKKLSDFFIDQKIDIISKRDATVLTTNGQIMCLPGLRIDNRFKVTVDTKKILEISIC